MLSKLLKYEIKATARIFLPLYLVLLIFAGINQLITSLSPEELGFPFAISMFLYIIILVGVFIITFIVMIQRFYKNLLSDEGYLMFTLPTQSWKHIMSKLLVSMMWIVISILVSIVSIVIIAMDKIQLSDITYGLQVMCEQIYNTFGTSVYLLIIELILGSIIGLGTSILMIYASIAIGHLFNQHRILASMGAYIALNTITQILSAISGTVFFRASFFGSSEAAFSNTPESAFIHYVMWFCIILSGILAAGYYITTNIILSKRLNLE